MSVTVEAPMPGKILEIKVKAGDTVKEDDELAVLEAMDDYYRRLHANVHRGVHTLSEEATAAYENARLREERGDMPGAVDGWKGVLRLVDSRADIWAHLGTCLKAAGVQVSFEARRTSVGRPGAGAAGVESFSPQGKARAEQMVADIKAAFRAVQSNIAVIIVDWSA